MGTTVYRVTYVPIGRINAEEDGAIYTIYTDRRSKSEAESTIENEYGEIYLGGIEGIFDLVDIIVKERDLDD